MTTIARRPAHHSALPATEPEAEPSEAAPLKVNLSPAEKAAFIAEAESHGQKASAYARFILGARKDPLLFLQLCRLRDPGFAKGLMGNPADAGRVAELEKRLLEATHAKEEAERDRDDAERRATDAERRLSECAERQEALAGYVVDLARVQDGARERALATGAEYESVPGPFLGIIKALSAKARMSRKDLEARLADDGTAPADATQAVNRAARMGLIRKGQDGQYRLAKQPEEE